MTNATRDLVILACSGTKLPYAAPALDLYQGVMYGTFRANVRNDARPHVVILSALHGFICSDKVIEPYEQRLTAARADHMVSHLADFLPGHWPEGVNNVLLAGGAEYRRVMRAAVPQLVDQGSVTAHARVTETSGGIGYQRQQLGEFLRGLAPARDVVGHHPNGTPLYRSLGGFNVDQSVDVAYASRPDLPARPALIEQLFEGPAGPTACVLMLDARDIGRARTWVGLHDLKPGHSLF
ncbi:DUF6884 domain-containing protein [Paraburkholderia caledonica]